MAEEQNNQPSNTNETRHVAVNAQYIKDLSFESPGAPASLTNIKKAPKIDVSVDIQINKLQDTAFEVNLMLNAKATSEENEVFLIELAYGGVFTVDVPDAEREPVLMVYCPSILFPYARRIISDTTRDGGFPPLMLDPIDFGGLYQQHKNKPQENTTMQ